MRYSGEEVVDETAEKEVHAAMQSYGQIARGKVRGLHSGACRCGAGGTLLACTSTHRASQRQLMPCKCDDGGAKEERGEKGLIHKAS
jgi:hypothetical protein